MYAPARTVVRAKLGLDMATLMFRRMCVEVALAENKGNKSRAARDLGVHRNTLMRELQRDRNGVRRKTW
jgi:DNA-binding NtrC family response regulator